MTVMVGCPPQTQLYFDIARSIGELNKYYTYLNCLNRPEVLPCFYIQNGNLSHSEVTIM